MRIRRGVVPGLPCSDANPLALAGFERRFIGRVREVVVRVDPSYHFVAEVEQILRGTTSISMSARS